MDLTEALADVVGADHVLVDPDLRASAETDWTGRYRGPAAAVVRPGSTADVAEVVRVCAAAGAAIVPQGGNTGLVGASVPRDGEVVLSLTRLDGLEDVDRVAAQVTAGAGVTLARLQAHAEAAGLAFPVDLGARDSATLGGMVATNAGGVRVLRYGPMRSQLAGVEAVLADGQVLTDLAGLDKDNTGYHLPGLLCGSEGTLAIVTRVRLRLARRLPARVTALLAVDDVDAAVATTRTLRDRLANLEAAELMLPSGLELVAANGGGHPPVGPAGAYLLVECADRSDPTEALAAAVAEAGITDAAVATDHADRRRLWTLREGHTEAINAASIPHKLDVSVPLPRLAAFCHAVPNTVRAVAPDARVILFGHVGDGNVHVNVLDLDPADPTVDDAVFTLVLDHGGSISAEHGIGVAKVAWLERQRGPAAVAAMRAIKQALDPQGILNPGVLLPS